MTPKKNPENDPKRHPKITSFGTPPQTRKEVRGAALKKGVFSLDQRCFGSRADRTKNPPPTELIFAPFPRHPEKNPRARTESGGDQGDIKIHK